MIYVANTIFKAKSTLQEGLQVKCEARQFSFLLDEPKSLGGTDQGMNPVEALLASLGGCKCIVAKAFAQPHGIKLNSVTVDLEGTLDPDGFLGANPNAKIGFSKIKSIFRIDADNTAQEIAKYVEFIESNCPVQDTLTNVADFETEIL